MDILQWIEAMEEQLKAFEKVEIGYPKGNNEILPPENVELLDEIARRFNVEVPRQLRDFFRVCGGVWLPDIYNGYFIFSLDRILRVHELLLPLEIAGSKGGKIIPFGDDGGGNLFAIRADGTDEVLYLPNGLIEESIYYDDRDETQVVAADFNAFLERLLADVKADIAQDEDWKYMV